MTLRTASPTQGGALLLVRHTHVAERYKKLCYGASDVALSPEGQDRVFSLAEELARENPNIIIHSGLTRTRVLADEIGRRTGLEPTVDARLKEMNFGTWELRPWDDIFAQIGHALAKLIQEPETYSAPEGETANQVRDRILAWARELPTGKVIIAVTHGGPIGALLGTLASAPSSQWPDFVPRCGDIVRLELPITV